MKINTWLRRIVWHLPRLLQFDTYLPATGLDMQTDIPTICLYVDDGRFIPFCGSLLVRYGRRHCFLRGACFPCRRCS